MMKFLLSLLLALTLTMPAMAEFVLTDDLTGVYTYPEGSTEQDALYVYRYRYPQLAGDSEAAMLLNTTYAYTAADALAFEAPMLASELTEDDPQQVVDVSYQVTCQSEEYLSFCITKTVTFGDSVTTVATGHVFSLQGDRIGTIISLPHLLGILDGTETDEWYQERQTAKATRCARELVWDALDSMDLPLYDDLTFEEFEAGFYPEEDFYLNKTGDPVFYLLPGSVCPPEEGEVLVTIPLDVLLDEI